ncbi:MAG: molecular chaperone HtpG [Prolixibacteraceae bacterium]|nr:molecular chaperone HtpG [Prolixibacteraceae bacterium]
MQKGHIGVTSEDLFPIIKKFLYSDHDIFLREIVSNAVDATMKLKTLARRGETPIPTENAKVNVILNEKDKTLTVSDNGLGMTAEEVEKYINQIAFSGASDFLDKYKKDANAIIGHFGLGFYSAFMVSSEVEIISKSYKEGSKAVKWTCDGSPEFNMDEVEKAEVGTDIVMHINDDSNEFLDKNRILELLTKYCKFLPIPVIFGKKTEWKDGKEVETAEDNQINDTEPAWTKKPVDLKEEDYTKFYHKLYPYAEDPIFHIHLNVDYPFNLTGILYFPHLKNTMEVQKNKIQLYCNQVFVTDSVEGIVPDFLTLLHGVIDSPDIPLNVSRSYLQGDPNVKKISSHITKKVGDRLSELFKSNRPDFEKKWDDLKIFIEYGILSEEKFAEKAKDYYLFKNTEDKYFTADEYEKLIGENQKDKDGNLFYLYTSNKEEEYTSIQDAKNKGYDVLVLDDILTAHLVNKFEQNEKNHRFVRVDSDVIDNLIKKEDKKSDMSFAERETLSPLFRAVCPKTKDVNYIVDFSSLGADSLPMTITHNEFMRRMKDMSKLQGGGGGMNMYGNMPESLNLVVNTDHPLVKKVLADKDTKLGDDLGKWNEQIDELKKEEKSLEESKKDKKEAEIPQSDKEKLEDVKKKISGIESERSKKMEEFGKSNNLTKQLVDLALLANGILKGKDLDKFVRRSVDMIK